MRKKIRKVLIISKMTELEFDEFKFGSAVDEYYKLRKVDVKKLEENHEYHYQSLDRIVRAFKANGVSPGLIKKQNLGRSDFKEHWDLIVPTGGDGTFMDAARYVHDATLFFGIKSTPRSIGGHYYTNFSNAEEHIGRVLRGDFKIEKRARIEGTVQNEITITDLALNDLYLGDRYVVGYSRLEMHIGGRMVEANGNGIIFSTYHGRTGWYDNVPVVEKDEKVQLLVRDALRRQGLGEDVRLLSTRCDFLPKEEHLIKYKIVMRDQKRDSSFPDYGILKPGDSCTVVSRVLSNGCISFDGNKTSRPRHRMYDMSYGSTATIRVSDKPLSVVRL